MAGTGGAGTGALALGAADQPAGAQHPPGDHVRHAHRAEIEVDLVAELFPEVMGLAATLVAAAAERLAGRAAGGTDRLVDRQDDVGDARLAGRMSEQVAAARPAHGTQKAATPELAEELLPTLGRAEGRDRVDTYG